MSTNFKKASAFKDDKFKYEHDNFTPDEVKDLEGHGYDASLAKEIQDKKDLEFVETMEDDIKATKYVADKETDKIKKAQDLKEEAANYVDMAKGGSYNSYKCNLAEWGMYLLMQKRFKPRYDYHVVPTKPGSLDIFGKNFKTKDGVIFVLRDMQTGSVFVKAIGISTDTMVDVSAVQLMCVEVENTVDACEGSLEATDSNKIVEDAVRKHGLVDQYGKPIKS